MYLANGDTIEVITASAATCDLQVDANDALLAGTPGGSVPDYINSVSGVAAATTQLVADVGDATKYRCVNEMHIFNRHASTSTLVTIRRKNAGGTYKLYEFTLAASESFHYRKESGIQYLDLNGTPKMTGIFIPATQAEQESATSTTAVVTPGRQQYHPASAKAWCKLGVSGGVPALTVGYNVGAVTDTGLGIVTFLYLVPFSSANYAVSCNAELTATTYAVANDRKIYVRNATQLASQISLDCIDSTAVTNAPKDPTTWYFAGYGDQ